jgi:hypothetical protein
LVHFFIPELFENLQIYRGDIKSFPLLIQFANMGNDLNTSIHYVQDETYYLWKVLTRQLTGQSEIARICAEEQLNSTRRGEMNYKFAKSLKHSHQLTDISSMIFKLKKFSVSSAKRTIIEKKNIPNDESHKSNKVQKNISMCLAGLKIVNLAFERMTELRQTSFSYENPLHVSLLEKLWNVYMPDTPRSLNRLSDEWGELGFQGKDPATDFRGMGILSLLQLIYFAEHYPTQARGLLTFSNDSTSAYFPFAATSINMTALVVEFFTETRFHQHLLHHKRLMHWIATYETNSAGTRTDAPNEEG